jgi:chaperonin cofactor prefoldin
VGQGLQEEKKKNLSSTVKENPLASLLITAVSSALVTFLSQTYATTGYVEKREKAVLEYVDRRHGEVDGRLKRLEDNHEKVMGKLDEIRERLPAKKG